MAIFLSWKNTNKDSKERFIISLFSNISSRWYPANIINSLDRDVLDTYDFFDTYSEELFLAKQEINQTFKDLSIDTVRTSPVANRSTTKIYDNFGAVFETYKLEEQDFDKFNFTQSLQPYRQELRFLNYAYQAGSTTVGLQHLGYAFTGISPRIEDHIKEYE
ncbi:MAG: hypothetical protein WC346_06465, partial [Methanogenium sp.]